MEFFKKAGVVFFIKIIGLAIAFFLQLILTNNLSSVSYGEYTLFLTYINILTMISLLGLDNSLIKEIPLVKRAYGESILLFFLKIAFLSTIVISIIYFFLFKKDYGLSFIILVISATLIRVLIMLLDSYFQGKGKIVEVNIYSVLINNILKVVLFIFLKNYKLLGLFYSYFIAEIFCLFLRSLRINIKLKNKLKISIEDKKKLLKYGITFTLITSISVLNQNFDKLILEYYLGLKAVGIYKVNQNYLSLLGIFVSPFLAFWPVISKLYSQNKIKEIEETLSNIIKLILIFVIPCFILICFKGNKLLELFGKEYSKYSLVLLLLSIGTLIDTSSGPIGAVLTMTKYQKITLYNSIFSLILNIFMSLFLVGKYGLIGVALSTTISIMINNLISIICNKLLLNIMPYKINILLKATLNLIILFLFQKFVLPQKICNNIVLDLLVNLILLGIVSIMINVILYFKISRNYFIKIKRIKKQ